MPVVRVYLPVGPVDLAELAERGSLSSAHRRVVIAADVDPEWLAADKPKSPPDSICAVELTEPVPLARVASFHIDERGASTDDAVAAAVDALLWYDATELDEVRGFFV